MKVSARLYGLDVPDELADLKLKDADPTELFRTVYKAYVTVAKKMSADENLQNEESIYYNLACKMVRPHADKMTSMFKGKDVHRIIGKHDEETWHSGLFLSAICSQSTLKEIVWNNDYSMLYLAHRLPAGKTFINQSKAGCYMGKNAAGTVVNYNGAGDGMGWLSSGAVINCGKASSLGNDTTGAVINYGEVGIWMGFEASGMVINCNEASYGMGHKASGTIIALKDPSDFGDTSEAKLVLKEDDCKEIPELVKYFDNLKSILGEGKEDYRAFSKLPQDRKIMEGVENILRKRELLA